jgi:hypothetical protein
MDCGTRLEAIPEFLKDCSGEPAIFLHVFVQGGLVFASATLLGVASPLHTKRAQGIIYQTCIDQGRQRVAPQRLGGMMGNPIPNKSLSAALASQRAQQSGLHAHEQYGSHQNPYLGQHSGSSELIVSRLAHALVLAGPDHSNWDDAGDEDLDLPMLVQGTRGGYGGDGDAPGMASLPLRAGRFAMMGFGLGLALVIPVGAYVTLMHYSPPGAQTERADAASMAVTGQSFLPAPLQAPSDSVRNARRTGPADDGLQLSAIGTATAAPVPGPGPSPGTSLGPSPSPIAGSSLGTSPSDRLTQAQDLIARGDVVAARRILQPGAAEGNPLHLLALAETYDPNMLAAWRARDTEADAPRARQLYKNALIQGETKARQRIEALE